MIEIYKKVVFENYANFNGRARRQEYWTFFLANAIVSIVLGFIDAFAGLTFGPAKTGVLRLIYSLLVLIPSFAVAIRRIHDVGKSGWHILIIFYNLYLCCIEGEKGTNQYGPDPKNELEELEEIGKDLN